MGRRAQIRRAEKEKKKMDKRGNPLELPKPVPAIVKSSETTPQNPEQRREQANADPKAIVNHLQGKTVISFLMEDFDCCTEKCIMEYVNNFQAENFGVLLIPKNNYTDILRYLSNYVVLFRTGYKSGSKQFIAELTQYLKHVKGLGIRVVYYMDDLLFFSNENAPLTLMTACDAIIVSNPTLKEILVNKVKVPIPVIIVPTHMNLQNFDNSPDIRDGFSNRVRVLMTSGGRIGANDVYEICELANEDPEIASKVSWIFNCNGVAEIRSLVNKFRNLDKHYVDWVSLQTYYSLAKSSDIIIHPARPEDLAFVCPENQQQNWLDSKCEVKYTLAGAARIPIISAPTRAYLEAIKEGETGYIARSPQEFIDKIKMLTNDKQLRRKIGENARKDVEMRYDVGKRYPLYRDAILGNLPKEGASFMKRFVAAKAKNTLYIPPIEGGPRTFYENMKANIPIVSERTWEVVEEVEGATAAVSIAFVMADKILAEKERRPEMKLIYRLDGLPTDFQGRLDPMNLSTMLNIFPKADHFVWQSEHCRRMWFEREVLPKGRDYSGTIIHNGVNLSIFKPDGNGFGFPNPAKFNFLHLNWSTFPHKRLDLLQDTIREFAKYPDVRFYLIGNYISTSQIANMTFWQDFPNATYLGVMRNQTSEARHIMATILRTASGLIFTSEMEGSPNTVLEALGCGCPVIYNAATDIVPEILDNACIRLDEMEKILDPNFDMNAIKKRMADIAPRFSIQSCIRKYMEILK